MYKGTHGKAVALHDHSAVCIGHAISLRYCVISGANRHIFALELNNRQDNSTACSVYIDAHAEAMSLGNDSIVRTKHEMLYLHVEEAKAFAVQQQGEDNEGQRNICAQNAQRCNADKVPEERLLPHRQPCAEDDGRQKEPAAHNENSNC